MNVEVCSSPVTAVSDTVASVSCSRQRLLKQPPLNFQNQLQPTDRQLLAATQAELSFLGTVTLPISLDTKQHQQQFFVLQSSEADCLFCLEFLEDSHCDALHSSMQLRFLNFQTVPLLHSRRAPSDPSLEQFKVIARETTFITAGHAAVILGELLTQGFPEKSEEFFEPSPAFCKKNQLLASSFLCESGEMIPARLISPDEDVTNYKCTSLESSSVVGSAEMAEMN